MIDKFMRNPATNSLAVVVLAALIVSWVLSVILISKDTPVSVGRGWYTKLMLLFSLLGVPAVLDLIQTNGIALAFAVITFLILALNIVVLLLHIMGRISHGLVRDWKKWAVPILAVGGIAVAGYFTYLELTGETVLCGPSSGCDDVQNSKFAVLFDVVPLGMFGLAGYFAILAAWLAWQYGPDALKKTGVLSMWGFCMFGVIFSIYLTFLEPFVIGATCIWCITSAVFMMVLLLVTTPSAQEAFFMDDVL